MTLIQCKMYGTAIKPSEYIQMLSCGFSTDGDGYLGLLQIQLKGFHSKLTTKFQ